MENCLFLPAKKWKYSLIFNDINTYHINFVRVILFSSFSMVCITVLHGFRNVVSFNLIVASCTNESNPTNYALTHAEQSARMRKIAAILLCIYHFQEFKQCSCLARVSSRAAQMDLRMCGNRKWIVSLCVRRRFYLFAKKENGKTAGKNKDEIFSNSRK